jgi:hypothetical protein
MKKQTSIKEIKERLKGIDKDIPNVLEEFYQSTLVGEIKTEELRKYEEIKEVLRNEELYYKVDNIFMNCLKELIETWCPYNQEVYY